MSTRSIEFTAEQLQLVASGGTAQVTDSRGALVAVYRRRSGITAHEDAPYRIALSDGEASDLAGGETWVLCDERRPSVAWLGYGCGVLA